MLTAPLVLLFLWWGGLLLWARAAANFLL